MSFEFRVWSFELEVNCLLLMPLVNVLVASRANRN